MKHHDPEVAGKSSGNALDLYTGGDWFEPPPRERLH
jgi:hypothetical protein